MKKWLVPLVFPFIYVASLIAIYALADWANGDGTGYGGVVYGLIGMIFYCVIVIPAICIAYSKCCLSGQKFRLLFIFYQSFLIGLPYYIPNFMSRDIVYIAYSAILFAWCVLWGLIGLIRSKRKIFMTTLMKDDMIKENKRWKTPMILFFALAVLFPFALIWNDMKTSEFIAGEIFFILMGCYFLYGYSYTYQYKVIVTNEKIVLKTLFKNTEIELKDIKAYHCKRYGKSEFYQFSILGKDKKILIHTRYQDDFEKLLKENKTILE